MAVKPIDFIMQGIERQRIRDGGVEGLYDMYVAYINGTLNPIYQDFERLKKDFAALKERVEVLDGTRTRGAVGRAAVRYEDLRALGRFPTRPPNYKYLGAAPSASDYNALAADVKKLYETLGTIASVLGVKL